MTPSTEPIREAVRARLLADTWTDHAPSTILPEGAREWMQRLPDWQIENVARLVAALFAGPDADGFYRLRVRAEPQLSDPPPSATSRVPGTTQDGPEGGGS